MCSVALFHFTELAQIIRVINLIECVFVNIIVNGRLSLHRITLAVTKLS